MDYHKIEECLLGRVPHSVITDICDLEGVPGWLRIITVYPGLSVWIELLPAHAYLDGSWRDTSGLRYIAEYQELGALVADLEQYTGRRIGSWVNYNDNAYEPRFADELDPAANAEMVHHAVRERSFPLPRGAVYRQGDLYWRHIERYGEFRPDKLEEEEQQDGRDE